MGLSKLAGPLIDKVIGIMNSDHGIKNPSLAKAVKIAKCALIIILGLVAFAVMMGILGQGFGALVSPSIGKLMSIPVGLCLAALGLKLLIENVIPKKYHRTLTKVFVFVIPILLAGAAFCLLYSPVSQMIAQKSMVPLVNDLLIVEVGLIAGSFYSLHWAIQNAREKKPSLSRRVNPTPTPKSKTNRKTEKNLETNV